MSAAVKGIDYFIQQVNRITNYSETIPYLRFFGNKDESLFEMFKYIKNSGYTFRHFYLDYCGEKGRDLDTCIELYEMLVQTSIKISQRKSSIYAIEWFLDIAYPPLIGIEKYRNFMGFSPKAIDLYLRKKLRFEEEKREEILDDLWRHYAF